MNFIEKIKRYFYQRHLNSELGKTRHQHTSISLDESKTIGILFDATESKQSDAVLKYASKLKKQGKKVQLLGFIHDKNEIETDFPSFNLKDTTLSYIPKGERVEQFIKEPFDLLINLFFEENLALEYISTLSKARFRIGRFVEHLHCFDLMINSLKKEGNIPFFTQQMELFLQKMNKPAYV